MTFLFEALIFLCAAIVAVPICRRLGLSAVLGYLFAGLIIGPSGLELVGEAEEVLHFSELGVVLLLFIIGLELQPKRLWVMRKLVFGLGTAQIGVSTTVIAAICHWVLGLSASAAVLIGFALALSSTAFVLQLLGEQRKLNKPHGRAAFGTLLMQDVAVIPAIALVSVLAASPDADRGLEPWYLVLVLGGLVVARFSLRPVLRLVAATGVHELFSAASLALVVGAALAMSSIGLSMGLGAFIAGLMVADSEYRHQLQTDVTPFKGLLLGLFFIAVGMSANLGLLLSMPLLIVTLTVALMLVKTAIVYPLARMLGLARIEALRTGLVLSQGGEFAFVLLTAAAGAAVIGPELADIAILVITLSMAATPLLVAAGNRIGRAKADDRPYDEIDELANPVIIAGFGRVGQIVSRVLSMRHIPFTVLEASPGQVELVRQYGNQVYFGDATRLDTLRAAQLDKARAIVIAVNELDASLKIAEHVRATAPKVAIFARAANRHHELRLRELGVDFVIRDTLVSTLELTSGLLTRLGLDKAEADAAVTAFREHDQRTLNRQLAVFHDESKFRQSVKDAAQELRELFREDASVSEAANE
jgi:monovalent cation:proton antiporter-2 (CPA2) family protein